jgi:hypothetical protein
VEEEEGVACPHRERESECAAPSWRRKRSERTEEGKGVAARRWGGENRPRARCGSEGGRGEEDGGKSEAGEGRVGRNGWVEFINLGFFRGENNHYHRPYRSEEGHDTRLVEVAVVATHPGKYRTIT